MTNAQHQEQDGQALARFQEIRGPKERLTEAQIHTLAALAAGYIVCMSTSSSVASHEQVHVGNGSRLSAVTVERLLWRDLIKQSGYALEPHLQPGYPEHWRKKLHFYQLTERGHNVVLRQRLHFVPEEVILSLPCQVSILLEEVARYQLQHHCEPEVDIRGTLDSERLGWCLHLSTWRQVAAYNEAKNLLGVYESSQPENHAPLLWGRPPRRSIWHHTSPVRVRLHPM